MKIFPLLTELMIFAGFATAQVDLNLQLDSLVATERSFADSVAQKGIRDGFLEFLADDAVLFRPQPVDGVPWMKAHSAAPGLLSWEPTYAEIAASADLGYTTGPWEYRPKGAADTVVAYGIYVSIWKKLTTGWKVVIDVGIGSPKPSAPTPALRIAPSTGNVVVGEKVQAGAQSGRASLMKTDQDFSKAARKNGLTKAYVAHSAEDVVFFRDELVPMTGKESMSAFLNNRTDKAAWNPMRAEVSAAGDLGYTYGAVEATKVGESDTTQSYYLRIWRRNAEGNWRVILDIENPARRTNQKPKE